MENISVLRIGQFKAGGQQAFYVNSISNHLETSHLHINKPHKHDFYAAMLFTKGSGIHDIDFNTYAVKPGSAFLLAPGQTHHWELSEDIEGFIFFHTQAFYDMHYIHESVREYPFFSSMQSARSVVLADTVLSAMTGFFEKMYAEDREKGLKSETMVLGLITQIYIGLYRAIVSGNRQQAGTHNRYNMKFSAFEKLLETHFLSEKSPDQYAKRMNMTAKHLNRINKAVIHKTTSEMILERIILEAKRMLIYSAGNSNEIAYALGYEDYAYFSKLFKKQTGETPTQFRRKYD